MPPPTSIGGVTGRVPPIAPTPAGYPTAAAVAALTDNGGGVSADGTIGAITAPTALAATLTDSTGKSGSHDDTLAAASVPSDLTGGESPTEAEHNAALAAMRVIDQNVSDVGQKVIELVTAQAANRLAIVALTDAVKELSAKQNAVIASLKAAGIMLSS